jgi:hypothetical protein
MGSVLCCARCSRHLPGRRAVVLKPRAMRVRPRRGGRAGVQLHVRPRLLLQGLLDRCAAVRHPARMKKRASPALTCASASGPWGSAPITCAPGVGLHVPTSAPGLHGLTPAHICALRRTIIKGSPPPTSEPAVPAQDCAGAAWAHPRPHLRRDCLGSPLRRPDLGLAWAAAYSSILNLKLFRNSYGGDAALRQIAAAGDADQQLQATLVLS